MNFQHIDEDITLALLQLREYGHDIAANDGTRLSAQECLQTTANQDLAVNDLPADQSSNIPPMNSLTIADPLNSFGSQVTVDELHNPTTSITDQTQDGKTMTISLPPLREQMRYPKHYIVPILDPEIKDSKTQHVDFIPYTLLPNLDSFSDP